MCVICPPLDVISLEIMLILGKKLETVNKE